MAMRPGFRFFRMVGRQELTRSIYFNSVYDASPIRAVDVPVTPPGCSQLKR